VVVFISATFSYLQEGKASDVMKSFKNMLPAQSKVIRDGSEKSLPAAELVPGDILIVQVTKQRQHKAALKGNP
jgi:magnesium-transporting ATPase (P-type)